MFNRMLILRIMFKPGRQPPEYRFCNPLSWGGRLDIHGNCLCEPCVNTAEAFFEEERRQVHDRK
jgi:hypothetical protein